MASVPGIGDKISAKVRLLYYAEPTCKKPIPPGNGMRGGLRIPEKLAGQEVGIFTGETGKTDDGKITYLVSWIFQFRVIPPWPRKAFDSFNPLKSWVRSEEVTGFWDKGVDSPLNDPNNAINTPIVAATDDNTNTYLILALAATVFIKYILPKLKNR